MSSVVPPESERFCLQVLLVNDPGDVSFRDLRSVNERVRVASVKRVVCLEYLQITVNGLKGAMRPSYLVLFLYLTCLLQSLIIVALQHVRNIEQVF